MTREQALAEGISSTVPPSLRHSLLGLACHQSQRPSRPSSPLPGPDGPFSQATRLSNAPRQLSLA